MTAINIADTFTQSVDTVHLYICNWSSRSIDITSNICEKYEQIHIENYTTVWLIRCTAQYIFRKIEWTLKEPKKEQKIEGEKTFDQCITSEAKCGSIGQVIAIKTPMWSTKYLKAQNWKLNGHWLVRWINQKYIRNERSYEPKKLTIGEWQEIQMI